jgi:hypothetical protein
MMYLIRNGRLVQTHYLTAVENNRVVVREGFTDCGPAPEPTRKQRALCIMGRLERRGQTGRRIYGVARGVALHEWRNNQ